MAGLFMMGGAMSVLSNAVSTMNPTVVSATPLTDVGNNAVYSRGGEFAQALAKVEPDPTTLSALQKAGMLRTPDTQSSLATLAQASTQASAQSTGQPTPTGTMAQLHQLLQAGGAQLQTTSRVALNLTS
jgi:hypothetical protein